MRITAGLSLLLLFVPVLPTAQLAAQSAARTVEIQVGDYMKYSVTTISAKPRERLRVVLKDVGKMPKPAMAHNFVLLKKGVDAKRFAESSSSARASDFIAPALKDEVLAATDLVGPGETKEVTFEAPADPGTYAFVCTFPGHFALGMKGTLVVSR